MSIEWNGQWFGEQEKWIRELIQGIPTFLSSHHPLFVGDYDATVLGKPGFMCYVSKPEHIQDPNQVYRAYFQPYHLRDREPICGIEVEYPLNQWEKATYRVQPMSMSLIYPM